MSPEAAAARERRGPIGKVLTDLNAAAVQNNPDQERQAPLSDKITRLI